MFRRGSDRSEAIGFGLIALVAVLIGIATGSVFAWILAVIGVARALFFLRAMRSGPKADGTD